MEQGEIVVGDGTTVKLLIINALFWYTAFKSKNLHDKT